ncbi:competence protein CoiA family protein, partial [Streptomyces phaeofaciens]
MTAPAPAHLHRALAATLADAARSTGHRAESDAPLPGTNWAADILVTSPDGVRTVLQIPPLPARGQEIRERTAHVHQRGLNIVWFTPDAHDPPWLTTVPAARVVPPAHPGAPWTAPAAVQALTREACPCGPAWDHGVHRTWAPPQPVSVPVLLEGLLTRRLVHATVQAELPGRRFTCWARGQDVRAEADHLRMLAATDGALTEAARASTPYIPRPDGRPAAPLGRLLEAARHWGHQHTGVVCHIETASADWMAGGFVVTPGRTPSEVTAVVRPLP